MISYLLFAIELFLKRGLRDARCHTRKTREVRNQDHLRKSKQIMRQLKKKHIFDNSLPRATL